jgi:serine/threonine protein kinase
MPSPELDRNQPKVEEVKSDYILSRPGASGRPRTNSVYVRDAKDLETGRLTVSNTPLGEGQFGKVRSFKKNDSHVVKSPREEGLNFDLEALEDETKIARLVYAPLPVEIFYFRGGERVTYETLKAEQKALLEDKHPPKTVNTSAKKPHLTYRLVQPHIVGKKLIEKLHSYELEETDKFINLYLQTAKAIARMHEKGLIHGDIHPENLIVSNDESLVTLIDFGCAYYKSDYAIVTSHSCSYWAPERINMGGKPDIPAKFNQDVYSFGHLATSKWGYNPGIEKNAILKKLFQKARDHNPLKRPTMPEIIACLQTEYRNALIDKQFRSLVSEAKTTSKYLLSPARLFPGRKVAPQITPHLDFLIRAKGVESLDEKAFQDYLIEISDLIADFKNKGIFHKNPLLFALIKKMQSPTPAEQLTMPQIIASLKNIYRVSHLNKLVIEKIGHLNPRHIPNDFKMNRPENKDDEPKYHINEADEPTYQKVLQLSKLIIEDSNYRGSRRVVMHTHYHYDEAPDYTKIDELNALLDKLVYLIYSLKESTGDVRKNKLIKYDKLIEDFYLAKKIDTQTYFGLKLARPLASAEPSKNEEKGLENPNKNAIKIERSKSIIASKIGLTNNVAQGSLRESKSLESSVSIENLTAEITRYHQEKGFFRTETKTITELTRLKKAAEILNMKTIPSALVEDILKRSDDRGTSSLLSWLFRKGTHTINRCMLFTSTLNEIKVPRALSATEKVIFRLSNKRNV